MNPHTKKFIRNRKIENILPWAGVTGMIILLFSPIFGGFSLFFKELGFVASFYFFIDEYNWLAQNLLVNPDHTLNSKNIVRVKKIFIVFCIVCVIYNAFVFILNLYSFYAFAIATSFLYVIYFSHHDVEFLLLICKKIRNQRFYKLITLIVFIFCGVSLVFLFINSILALSLLVFLGLSYVIERNLIKEIKRRNKGLDWEDDEDQYRFNRM